MHPLSLLARLVVPAACHGCGAPLDPEPGRWRLPVELCAPCLAGRLARAGAPAWRLEGLPVRGLFWYEEESAGWIRRIKEGGREAWLDRLAGLWPVCPLVGAAALAPVPALAVRRRERGGDHVDRLARRWSKAWRLPVVHPLVRGGRGLHQIGLDARQRRENLAGQYRLGRQARRPCPGPVLLVDDVVTTGATVAACLAALRQVGWPVAGVLALALTPAPELRGTELARLEQTWGEVHEEPPHALQKAASPV